ncbi:MAG: hypothetical protein ABI759_30355 [Candidatus Solibacter sp.]
MPIPIRHVAETVNSNDVFINCPFDYGYKPLFDALVFVIYDLGFVARCAREADDSGEVRLAKIERIIRQCKYGIHDISEVTLDAVNNLPRFNMPLELGIFFGCRSFGPKAQKGKVSLILDVEQYRYQKFISDIAGHDIRAHGGQPDQAIIAVRNWLTTASRRSNIPGGTEVVARYARFCEDLPRLCQEANLQPEALTFIDFSNVVAGWLKTSR